MSKTKESAKAPEKDERVSYELIRVVTRPDGTVDHERTAVLGNTNMWDDEAATLRRLVGLLDLTSDIPQAIAGGDCEAVNDWIAEAIDELGNLELDFGPMLRRIVGVDAE